MQQTEPDRNRFPGAGLAALLTRLEELLLFSLLTVMIALACYQIVLRWSTGGGEPWIDPLLRYLVLWSGLLGAALATAENKHISMNVIGYLVPPRLKPLLLLLVNIFSCVVALFLFRATLLFLRSEIEFGGTDLFGWPNWCWNLVFPLAFALIALHFGISALSALADVIAAVTGSRAQHG